MSKTQDNLKAAFAGESQASRKYTYFAEKADAEGQPQVARLFRAAAEAETVHARNHLNALGGIGSTTDNLKAAISGESYEYTQMYPGMAKTARDEGFPELAEWFETLAKAERSHANRFTKGLDSLKQG